MKEKFMNGMLIFAGKLQSNRYMAAIKDAFTDLMPIVIIGSFCTLFSNVICSTADGYLSLANVPGLAFLSKLNPIFTAANYACMNFMAVMLVILVSIYLGNYYKFKGDLVLPLTSLGSFIALCSTTQSTSLTGDIVTTLGKTIGLGEGDSITASISNTLGSEYTNSRGLFVAMIVGVLATEFYVKLVQSKKLEIKLPDSVPSNVAHGFSVLFPSAVVMLVVSLVGWLFETFMGLTVFAAITKFIQAPLSNALGGLPGYLVLLWASLLLWIFGIHGTQTLKAIYEAAYLSLFAENEAYFLANGTTVGAPNIINTPFMSCFGTLTGAGCTGGLIIAIMLFSKRDDYKAIGKIAIPCGIFNINEPLTFGLPIVLNPLLAIPFMITPLVNSAFAYFMTSIGFCGRMVVNAPWTTPPGIMAFLASGGNIGAAVTQLICVAISAVIYTPFVLIANKQPIEDEDYMNDNEEGETQTA